MKINHSQAGRLAPYRPRTNGITLIESLVGLSILGLLISFGTPTLAGMIAKHAVTAETNSLMTFINYARTEAIMRQSRVALCPSTENNQCQPSTNWDHGWLTYVDSNENRRLDPEEAVLAIHQSDDDQTQVHSSRGRTQLSFLPDGHASWSNGTYRICSTSGKAEPRAVIVSTTGRPRISTVDPRGKPLTCPNG